ncbi:hypothetical protein [Clostridium sp. KNHs216]|uniref:hypothetical protein n=1 Tax=Clostridium sp. KNHs216 TaxID=1550235 RepID=UPI00115150FB|nr:hypothetical protein [Clostridium sp. KNHs216]TQI67538.1 hypothetical protein LY85_2230 [Clostridium sp. KNHs216]
MKSYLRKGLVPVDILKKFRNKLVHFLFPFIERFYLFIALALLVAAWSIPRTYWQIRVVLFLLWLVTSEVNSAGIMEQDYLPMQPGSSPFYHLYRCIDRFFFLFLLVLLVILLLPEFLWLKEGLLGVFIVAVILRAIGDRKYRPKKPGE